ncbi:unnamed protein product [Rotaria sp. Silwood1]|nr:unnamed protein product [Rotaria sp. Silwood1]
MVKRTWNFVDKFSSEDELQSYIVQNTVSIKRTEEIEAGKKVIYRCSKYRKYPECDFQVKVIFSHDGGVTVSTSNEHDHAHRAATPRAPSPVREIVKNSVAAGLSCIQTRRAIEHQYQGGVSRSQLCSLLNYHRSLAVPDIHFVDDFRSWCHQHSALAVGPTAIHEPFVAKFYINSCNDIFVFITTRKLISTAPLSGMLPVDATFKLNWNELPVLVFGSSDGNRPFFPYGIAIIGTDEAASSYITLFQTVKECVFNVTGLQYNVQYLMADGGKGSSLLLTKWKSDPELFMFANYFEQTWLLDLKFWYEGEAIGYPLTNNGLESLNNRIKQQYTLRNKLPLPKFISTMDTMLREWSRKTAEDEFQTYPKISVEIEKQAWKWLKDLNKNSIFHWHKYATFPWKKFEDFSKWFYAGRLVTLPMMCSCKTNLKTYVCKHAVGISIHFGLYIISDPNKLESLGKRRGRPKKAGPALSR